MSKKSIIILSALVLTVIIYRLHNKKQNKNVLKAVGKCSSCIIISTATGKVYHANDKQDKATIEKQIRASGGVPLIYKK